MQPLFRVIISREFKSYVGLKNSKTKLENGNDFDFIDLEQAIKKLIGGCTNCYL